jgi:SAM-dependent methyltransferase
MAGLRQGYDIWVDECTQHHICGWTTAPSLAIALNDGPIGQAMLGGPHAGAVEQGWRQARFFESVFPGALWLDDEIAASAPDGTRAIRRLDPVPASRVQEFLRYTDPARAVSLEVGPLDKPVLPKTRFRVYYLDDAPRQALAARFAGLGVQGEAVVEVDFASGGRPYADLVGDLRFGFALASHVVEHVPDMIGWLWQLWSVLRDGAVLALAVPDARRTFDSRRNLTTLAEVTEAYFGRYIRPSPRQIIDNLLGTALHHGSADLLAEAFRAFHLANHSRKDGVYVDLHCHDFTPDSCVALLQALDRCGLLGFELLSLTTTDRDEFFVHLAKRDTKTLAEDIRP